MPPFLLVDKNDYRYYNINAFKRTVRTRGRRETVNEESPSVSGTGCRRNPGEGDFKESATENYRPARGKVEKAG